MKNPKIILKGQVNELEKTTFRKVLPNEEEGGIIIDSELESFVKIVKQPKPHKLYQKLE